MTMRFCTRLVLAGCGMTLLTAAGGPQEPGFIAPSWSRRADPAVAADMHPGFAAAIGISGVATVRCLAPADGPPTDCTIVSETPGGLGFGEAAVRIVSTAEVRAARLNGEISPRWVQTSTRFFSPDVDATGSTWTGPEPTPEALRLAGLMVVRLVHTMPDPTDDMFGGLAPDRRELVRTWANELGLLDPEVQRATMTLQLARILGEENLRRMMIGLPVPEPDREAFEAASPPPTPEQRAALHELRRRYCDRYDCGSEVAAGG